MVYFLVGFGYYYGWWDLWCWNSWSCDLSCVDGVFCV